jgi:hypothetical protein
LAEDPSASDLIYVHKYFQIFPDFICSLFYKLKNMPAQAAATLVNAVTIIDNQCTTSSQLRLFTSWAMCLHIVRSVVVSGARAVRSPFWNVGCLWLGGC